MGNVASGLWVRLSVYTLSSENLSAPYDPSLVINMEEEMSNMVLELGGRAV